MSKQATLSRWFRPVGEPAAAQKQATGSGSQVGPIASPSQRITLLDAVAELDINALRVLVGHLEAAKWCCPARLACRVLRDAVDTGISRLQLRLPLEDNSTATAGPGGAPVSPLLKRPSCTRLRLTFSPDWEDGEDGQGGDESADGGDGGGKLGEGGRGQGGVAESGEHEEGAAQGKGTGAAASSEDVGPPGEGQEQPMQQQGGEGREGCGGNKAAAAAVHGRNKSMTQRVTELAAWVFQGLPAGQRERIADLELDMGEFEDHYPAVNRSHLLEALGPLLPGLQHINLVYCQLSDWEIKEGENDKDLGAALAAAFPRLRAATMNVQVPLESLGTHMGARLERLALYWLDDPEQMDCKELVAQLSRALRCFTALKELVVEQLRFACADREHEEEALLDGELLSSELAFVRLLDSLPPALETLHFVGFHVDTRGLPQGRLRGFRMELGLRGGALRVLRIGWNVAVDDLYLIQDLVGRSRLAEGAGRIPLLQLGGLMMLGAREGPDPTWTFMNKHYERFELGRLHLSAWNPPGALAALALRYMPEQVVSGSCVVRLRGTGPPLSCDFGCPRWRLELGGLWTEGVQERAWATVAPSVGPALAAAEAAGLRLGTARAGQAVAVAAGALRKSVTEVLTAAGGIGGGASRAQQSNPQAHGGESQGGLQLLESPSRHSAGLLLLTGPFVHMLGPEPVVEAWLKDLYAGAAAARQTEGGGRRYFPRIMSGEPYYARVVLPHVAAARGAGARSVAQVQAGAEARAGAEAEGGAGAGAGAAGADMALLLEFAYCYDLDWVATQLAKQAGAAPPGSMHQGEPSGLQVARLRGRDIGSILHDAHMSPVLQALWDGSEGCGLGERQRLEKLFGMWGAVAEIAMIAPVPIPET